MDSDATYYSKPWNRKEGQRSVNRDEGSYTLSHTYDRFLATSHHYRGKNRKKKM